MCQPGVTVAKCFANGRKRFIEQIFPSPLAWIVSSGIIRPKTNASRWVQRAGFGQTFVASSQKVVFICGILRAFIIVARYHGIMLFLSGTAESKLRKPRPLRLCVLGSGDMVVSPARWSLKCLAFSAIINCSTQDYDTPSTSDEGDHCN